MNTHHALNRVKKRSYLSDRGLSSVPVQVSVYSKLSNKRHAALCLRLFWKSCFNSIIYIESVRKLLHRVKCSR